MRVRIQKGPRTEGSTLTLVMVIGGIMSVIIASALTLSSVTIQQAQAHVDWQKAFYHAENAYIWAAQNCLNSTPAAGSSNYYSTVNGTLPLAYMQSELSQSNNAGFGVNTNSQFGNAWVTVVQPTNQLSDVVIITASARVNNEVRTIQVTATLYPVSQVFDYEYFLNNWGWWWGNTITGNGGQRANWDFDFRWDPTVNGLIYAADQVEENEVPWSEYNEGPPFGGTAGTDPTDLVH